MIDVFFCTKAQSDIRKALGLACLTRWSMEPGINLHILMPDELVHEDAPDNVDAIGSLKDFDELKGPWADYHAASSIYVVAEDDWLPGAAPFVETTTNEIQEGRNFFETGCYGIRFLRKGAGFVIPAQNALHVGAGY